VVELLSRAVGDRRPDPDVAVLVQSVVARVLSKPAVADTPYERLLAVLDASGEVCDRVASSASRPRALLQKVSINAASYLNRFALREPWRFLGDEGGLVWEHGANRRCVIDHVRAGTSRNGHTMAREAVMRLHNVGAEMFGADYAGVRLLWLDRPTSSQWYAARTGRGMRLDLASFDNGPSA
jgi:hypothetical protein